MEEYDGTQDPMKHFETFKVHMMLHEFLGKVACRAFPLTLRRSARTWFVSLVLESIEIFDELAHLFVTHFMASRRRRLPAAFFLTIKQREDEVLKALPGYI